MCDGIQSASAAHLLHLQTEDQREVLSPCQRRVSEATPNLPGGAVGQKWRSIETEQSFHDREANAIFVVTCVRMRRTPHRLNSVRNEVHVLFSVTFGSEFAAHVFCFFFLHRQSTIGHASLPFCVEVQMVESKRWMLACVSTKPQHKTSPVFPGQSHPSYRR